jgi:PAS domain S-box-containing protein
VSVERAGSSIRLLVVAAGIETVLALTRRLNDAAELVHGDLRWDTVSGLLGLFWLPVMVWVLWTTVRRMGWLGRRTREDAAAIAASASTSHEWQWEAGTDLVTTWSNDRVQDLLGYSVAEVVGRPITDLLADPGSPRARAILSAGVRTAAGWHDVEAQWLHADGHVVALEGSASVLLDDRGRPVGLRGARRLVPAAVTAERARQATRDVVQAVLMEESLQIALQPIRCLQNGEVAGYEALARFADETPDAMFAMADSVDLGLELELLAVRAALPLLDELPDDQYLSVNASPALILDGRLAERLAQRPGVLDRLVLEVTERLQVTGYGELHAVLAPLRACGMRLAVDDTGAGYASFSHVLKLQPDIIKLDRSLISAIDVDAAQRSLVIAVALLALDLGATLTAEGVETATQLAVLVDLGIDHGQGWHLGRPTLDVPRRTDAPTADQLALRGRGLTPAGPAAWPPSPSTAA